MPLADKQSGIKHMVAKRVRPSETAIMVDLFLLVG